mgnify:CR=1 FL=1
MANKSNVVIYQTLPAAPKEILMVFTLDEGKFQVWGKPKTGYAKLAEDINKQYILADGNYAFENYFSGGTFSKLESRWETLTPRERKKLNALLKGWVTKRNGSSPTT